MIFERPLLAGTDVIGAARSRVTTWLRLFLFATSIVAGPFTYAYADDAVDRLVRLVGRDAGLCVEIPRLDETVTAFESGEFFQRLQRSKVYADWQSGSDYRRARGIVTVIENFTGKNFRQFFRETFGTAVVVAVYPEPGQRMSAIMLTETVSREALDAVIDGWNRAESQQTVAIPFAGRTYYKRTCAAKPDHDAMTLYYCKLDRTLMLSDHEEWVRRSLTLARETGSHDSLLDLPAYQQARQSLQPGSAARAYVNPRGWDSVLGFSPAPSTPGAARDEHKPSGESVVSRAIAAAWRRCEWLALGLQVDRGVVVEAVAHYSTNGLSPGSRRFIDSMAGPAEFLRYVPFDAMVVLAGRQAFGKLIRHSLPIDTKDRDSRAWDSFRQVSRGLLLGLDLFDDVLPAFRENWGAYLAPRRDTPPNELPIDGLIAAQLPEVPPTSEPTASAGHKPPFRDAIDNGLNTGFNFIAAYFNMSATGKPAVVRTESSHGLRIRWIDSLGPYQPAFGLTSGFLVFATSPHAVRSFAAIEAEAAAKTGITPRPPAIDRLAKRYFPTENEVLFIDTAAVRRFLREHGPQLVQHCVRMRSLASQDAEKSLREFLDVTGLFDAVFAAGRLGDGSARLVLGGVVSAASTSSAR